MEVTREKKLELINKIKFFHRFHEEDKITMADMAIFETYQPGQAMIEQGGFNAFLFFVINGSVDIDIDGKLITNLAGGGHLFGDMSFVYQQPASASVIAKTKVTAMMFDTKKINDLKEHYRMKMEIYRSCAEILAERLIKTNAKVTL